VLSAYRKGSTRGSAQHAAIVRYLVAATLARGADAGAAAGLVLLAVSPATHLGDGAKAGALLAVGLTAPHLLGPWLARRLDGARDGRVVLAAAFGAYGGALAVATMLLGRASLALAAGAVVCAGACGPLLTGGLSSRLAGLAGSGDRAKRRAEGWDAVSYGLAGTLGPAVVAALAAVTTPVAGLLALAGAAVVAAAVVMTLPRGARPGGAESDPLTVRAAVRLVAVHGPLRRVSAATAVTAFSFGGFAVIAVVLAERLGAGAGAGASLVAAFGLGNLAGSLLVTAVPLRGEPELLTSRTVAVMGAMLALCAVAPSFPLAVAAFALAGASNAPFMTATLAARSRYAPPRARAQVFVSLAGAKVASASAGTAVAGAAIGLGPRALLAAGAALTAGAAAGTVLDRRREGELARSSSAPG